MKIITTAWLATLALGALALDSTHAHNQVHRMSPAKLQAMNERLAKNRIKSQALEPVRPVRAHLEDHRAVHILHKKEAKTGKAAAKHEQVEEIGDAVHISVHSKHRSASKPLVVHVHFHGKEDDEPTGEDDEPSEDDEPETNELPNSLTGSGNGTDEAVGDESGSYDSNSGSLESDSYESSSGSYEAGSSSYEAASGSYEAGSGSDLHPEDVGYDGPTSNDEGDLYELPDPAVSSQSYDSGNSILKAGAAFMSTLTADNSPFGIEGSKTFVLVASIAGAAVGVLGVIIAIVNLRRQDDGFGPSELASDLPEPQSGRNEPAEADEDEHASASEELDDDVTDVVDGEEGTFANDANAV